MVNSISSTSSYPFNPPHLTEDDQDNSRPLIAETILNRSHFESAVVPIYFTESYVAAARLLAEVTPEAHSESEETPSLTPTRTEEPVIATIADDSRILECCLAVGEIALGILAIGLVIVFPGLSARIIAPIIVTAINTGSVFCILTTSVIATALFTACISTYMLMLISGFTLITFGVDALLNGSNATTVDTPSAPLPLRSENTFMDQIIILIQNADGNPIEIDRELTNKENLNIYLHENQNHQIILKPKSDLSEIELCELIEQHGPKIIELDLRAMGDKITRKAMSCITSSCVNLTSLKISSLMIYTLINLRELPKLKVLSLSGCTGLTTLPCSTFNFAQLDELDLSGCDYLSQGDQWIIFTQAFKSNKEKAKAFIPYFSVNPMILSSIWRLDEKLRTADVDLINKFSSIDRGHLSLFLYELSPDFYWEGIRNILSRSESEPNEDSIKYCIYIEGLSDAIQKKLKTATFEEYEMARQLDIPMPEECNAVDLLKSGFKALQDGLIEPEALNIFFYHDQFNESVTNYLRSEEGQLLLIENRERIFASCPNIKTFVEETYPVSDPENGLFYPLTISREGWIECASNLPTMKPVETLHALAEAIRKYGFKNIRVTFHGQKGADGGALRRQFLSDLFRALSLKNNFSQKIPEWKEALEPILQDISIVWKKLLQLTPVNALPIGEVFYPDFFKILLTFTHAETRQNFKDISPKRLIEIIFELTTTNDAQLYAQKLKSFLQLEPDDVNTTVAAEYTSLLDTAKNIYDIEEVNSGLTVETLKVFQDAMLNERILNYKNTIRTVHSIAKDLNCCSAQWTQLQGLNALAVQTHIQGTFSKELLITSFKFERPVSQDRKNYIIEWAQNKSDDELKQFLQNVFGSPTIPVPGIPITFGTVWGNNHCQISACSSSITFLDGLNNEELTAALNDLCRQETNTFNMV